MRCWLPEYIATLKKKVSRHRPPAMTKTHTVHSICMVVLDKKNTFMRFFEYLGFLLGLLPNRYIRLSMDLDLMSSEITKVRSRLSTDWRFRVKKEKFEAEITYFFRPRCSCVHFLRSIDNCIDYSTDIAGITLTICIDRRRAPELPSFKTLLRSTRATYWSTSGYDFLLWCFIKA